MKRNWFTSSAACDQHIRSRRVYFVGVGLALAWPMAIAIGQDGAPPSANPQQEQRPAKEEPAKKPEPRRPAPPSLDDLLGIAPEQPPEKEPGAAPRAEDPSRAALERRLTANEATEQFAQAVQLMGETATRLKVSRDAGIETQRLQDEIIRKLDMLIQMAEQQQQQQQNRQQQSGQQSEPGEQQQQASQTEPADGEGQGDPDMAQSLPAGQDPSTNPEIAARGAAWGNLPDRARDALLQGNADTYSSMYRRWTEAYYRRLAEEGNR